MYYCTELLAHWAEATYIDLAHARHQQLLAHIDVSHMTLLEAIGQVLHLHIKCSLV